MKKMSLKDATEGAKLSRKGSMTASMLRTAASSFVSSPNARRTAPSAADDDPDDDAAADLNNPVAIAAQRHMHAFFTRLEMNAFDEETVRAYARKARATRT